MHSSNLLLEAQPLCPWPAIHISQQFDTRYNPVQRYDVLLRPPLLHGPCCSKGAIRESLGEARKGWGCTDRCAWIILQSTVVVENFPVWNVSNSLENQEWIRPKDTHKIKIDHTSLHMSLTSNSKTSKSSSWNQCRILGGNFPAQAFVPQALAPRCCAAWNNLKRIADATETSRMHWKRIHFSSIFLPVGVCYALPCIFRGNLAA